MSTIRRQQSVRWLTGRLQYLPKLRAMPGRLELERLPEPWRSYAVVMTVVILVGCTLVLLHAFGVYPFDQTVVVPASSSPTGSALMVPPSLAVLIMAGLGLASGVLMLTFGRPGWRAASGRLFIAVVGAATMLPLLRYSWRLRSIWNGVDGVQAALQLQFVCVAVAGAAAGAAIPCSLFSKPKPNALAAGLTTLSYWALSAAFVALTVLWLLLGQRSDISDQAAAVFQSPIRQLVGTLTPALWLIGIVFFWLALAEARLFTREVGTRIVKCVERRSWFLPAVLAFKLALLTVVYAMSSGVAVWSRSRQDGVMAWLLAALFAAATTWWLSRDRRAVVMTQLGHAVAFLSLGFLLPFLVAYIIFVPAHLISTVNSELGYAIASLSLLISQTGERWTIVFAFLLLPLGLAGILLGRFRPLATLCLLTGLWTLPSIVTTLTDRDVSFEFLSYDAALTVGLAVLTVWAWFRNRLEDLRRSVTLALVVSTIAAYTDVTIATYQTAQSFAFLLLLPVGYQLLFDSHELNHTSHKAPYTVVQTLALQAILLLLIAWAVVTRQVTHEANTFEDVASRIFLPPLVALILAASLTPSAESSRRLEVKDSEGASA